MNKSYTKQSRSAVIFFGVLLCYWTYACVMRQYGDGISDYRGHLNFYYALFTKETVFEGWRAMPYFMWHTAVFVLNRMLHIPLEAAAAYSSCIFALFAYYVTYWMIQRILARGDGGEDPLKAGILAFGLSVVQGIFCYWLDAGERYLGIFSINPLHNPTQMCVKGFSLLCLALVYDIWGGQRDPAYRGVFFAVEKGLKKYYICLGALLFCSVLAKPTFAEMFIPAVGLLMLINWIKAIRKKDGSAGAYFQHCLHMLYCALPALGYMLVQYLSFFAFGAGLDAERTSVVFTQCMQVWSFFSENIVLSVSLGMAFPLFVVLLDPAYFIKDDAGKLALAGYLVGLLEAAFLGESEPRLYHGNFLWPMVSGMTLLWTVSLLRLLVLERTGEGAGRGRYLIGAAWFLFCVHALCGYLYIREITGL